jgi:stalled ribosome alternative rescue factor ArfA
MSRSIKDRRHKGVKRRNPIARALRAAAFRARQEANRRRYSRKRKHKPKPDAEPD